MDDALLVLLCLQKFSFADCARVQQNKVLAPDNSEEHVFASKTSKMLKNYKLYLKKII